MVCLELDGRGHQVHRFLRLPMDSLVEVLVVANNTLQVVQVVVVQVVEVLVEA